MGVDLTLMPVLFKESWLCHEMLECPRDRDLFGRIAEFDRLLVGEKVQSYRATDPHSGNTCYGDTIETPYGNELTWMPAGQLAELFDGETHWKAKAIRGYLAEMPEDWPVVLFWH